MFPGVPPRNAKRKTTHGGFAAMRMMKKDFGISVLSCSLQIWKKFVVRFKWKKRQNSARNLLVDESNITVTVHEDDRAPTSQQIVQLIEG